MASNGVIGACIENRIGEEGRWPAAIHDAKAAVRWLRANAPKYGVDKARIGAAGGSKGAWLASLLGTTDRVRNLEGDGGHSRFSSGVQSVVVLSPVLDLPAFVTARNERALRTLTEVMGASYSQDPELWKFASPVTHVSEQSAPHLFIVSAADPVTPAQPAIDMARRLDAAGVRAEVIKVDGGEHGFFNDPPSYQPVLEHMERWLRETLLNSVA